MTGKKVEERRAAGSERRAEDMDRRQFVDISWPRGEERRLASDDRRQVGDRRS